MNAKPQASNYKEIADEAVFQLECGKEFGSWMFSLMTAIRDDHKHCGGLNAAGLADLGVYLAETHFADAEQALEVVNDNLSSLGGAAMNSTLRTNTGVVDDLRDAQEILVLLAMSLALIASPSTHILVARVLAVFAQHTAMVWAELLDDAIAEQGGDV